MFWPPLLLDLLLLLLLRRVAAAAVATTAAAAAVAAVVVAAAAAVAAVVAAAAAALPLLAPGFRKTQNEKQSVVTGCAPRCIAGREAEAAQHQHSSSSSSSNGGGGGGGAAAAAASSPSESRAGCRVLSPLPSACVLFLCVHPGYTSLPWLRGFGLGIKLGACRPIVWTAGARMNLERSSVLIVHPSGKFRAVFLSSSFNLVPSGGFLE